MKYFASAILFFLNFSLLLAQEVSYESLHFYTELEASFLENRALQERTSLSAKVGLLMVVDSTIEQSSIDQSTKEIEELVASLRAANLQKKKPLKAAKLLYETVHENVLRKYDEDAQFSDLFASGLYNCVTATALYALLLDELDMPYQVRELPTHVYLIYGPGTANLIVESTDPVEGIFELDKVAIVDGLAEQKLISAAERRSKSVEQLYEDYVQEFETQIDVRGLASDLYYNAAILALQHEEYIRGTQLVQKSIYLNRNEAKVDLWANSLLLQLEVLDLDQVSSFAPLFALQAFPAYQVDAWDDISSNYYQATENYLIVANRREYYETVRTYFINHLSPEATTAREGIDFAHYAQLGRHYALLDKLDLAYIYFDSAYQLQPQHLNVQAALRDLVFHKIQAYLQTDETDELAAYIIEQEQLHPFLSEHERFRAMVFYSEFAPIAEAFDANKEEEALALFEERKGKLVTLNDGSEPFKEIVGTLFGSASSYYFRITDEKLAKQWLDEGLKIVPDSEGLLRKKEMLEDFYDK